MLVFQKFSRKKILDTYFTSTTCVILGNNVLEEYMEFGESSFCIGFTVADDTPPRV